MCVGVYLYVKCVFLVSNCRIVTVCFSDLMLEHEKIIINTLLKKESCNMHFKLFFKVVFFSWFCKLYSWCLFMYLFIHHRDVFLVFRLITGINLSVYWVLILLLTPHHLL